MTVILPCAGGGSRLGLPFPKELAPVGRGRLLIDSCLAMIESTEIAVRILLLDDGHREQTAARISRMLPGIPLARVRQDGDARDMSDALLKLEPWFSQVNVLLLPDAVYAYHGDPLAQVTAKLAASDFCFGACTLPPQALTRLGALRTERGHVLAYEDKPPAAEGYDSAWVMLGFTGGGGISGLSLLAGSALRQVKGAVTQAPVLHAPVVMLDGYRDCGSWDSWLSEVAGPPLTREDHVRDNTARHRAHPQPPGPVRPAA